MVNQGQNHLDSPANMLQQQASYEVSRNPNFHLEIENKLKKHFDKSSAVNEITGNNSPSSRLVSVLGGGGGRGNTFFLSCDNEKEKNFRHSHPVNKGGRKLIVITGIYV
jgi:hypothetical protein